MAGCVVTRINSDKAPISYKKVDVVIREYQPRVSLFRAAKESVVKVYYEGEEYEFHNAARGQIFYEGQCIQAYLSEGTMYADEAGIRSTSAEGKLYFVFQC